MSTETPRYAAPVCCGLWRTVPANTPIGGEFHLVPCPRCTNTFHGRLVERDGRIGVEEILDARD